MATNNDDVSLVCFTHYGHLWQDFTTFGNSCDQTNFYPFTSANTIKVLRPLWKKKKKNLTRVTLARHTTENSMQWQILLTGNDAQREPRGGPSFPFSCFLQCALSESVALRLYVKMVDFRKYKNQLKVYDHQDTSSRITTQNYIWIRRCVRSTGLAVALTAMCTVLEQMLLWWLEVDHS